jgi:aminoglycoside phosphotransferase (APT) family kinase protein
MTPRAALEEYLRERFGGEIVSLETIGTDGGPKEFGYGDVVRVHLRNAKVSEVVLHTARRGGFGHDTLADRATEVFLPWETFNHLAAHVRALDVGVVDADGHLKSLGDVRDFFLVTAYAEGEPYYKDLERIADTGTATAEDYARVERLATYLARIHRDKRDAPELWVRRLRDLVGGHECVAGLLDSYDARSDGLSPEARRLIEHWAVDWRHRLKRMPQRLCRVHGDFHPWNVLFDGEGLGQRFTLLDRSRGEWGEAADDLAAMAINYVFFSLRAGHDVHGPFRGLFKLFFETYITETEDLEVLRVIAPYFVWRALVVASPVWYPTLAANVRRRIFECIAAVMEHDSVDLDDLDLLFAP